MTVPEPSLAVVVINYEAGPRLLEAVRSVRADRSAGPLEVVVVDNGSADGSAAAVRDAFTDVRVIDSGGNVGYSTAANRGIASTRAEFVAVLNPDTIVGAGTAAAMLAALADPGIAAVGPAIHNPDGSVYPSARRVPSLVDAVGHGALGLLWPENPFTRRYRDLDADPTRARDVDWLSGAAIFMRRAALDRVGGWDEGYFMYVEDVDLCWRLRADGWRVRYDPSGVVEHAVGASTARHPYRMIVEHHRSLQRFAAKRWTGVRRLALPVSAAYLAVRAGFACLARRVQGAETARPRMAEPHHPRSAEPKPKVSDR